MDLESTCCPNKSHNAESRCAAEWKNEFARLIESEKLQRRRRRHLQQFASERACHRFSSTAHIALISRKHNCERVYLTHFCSCNQSISFLGVQATLLWKIQRTMSLCLLYTCRFQWSHKPPCLNKPLSFLFKIHQLDCRRKLYQY
jgi:hypothetical protein